MTDRLAVLFIAVVNAFLGHGWAMLVALATTCTTKALLGGLVYLYKPHCVSFMDVAEMALHAGVSW